MKTYYHLISNWEIKGELVIKQESQIVFFQNATFSILFVILKFLKGRLK